MDTSFKFTLWHIRLNIDIRKTTSCFTLIRNISQTFKSNSSKNVFPKFVYHWNNLNECILFYVITERHFLYKSVVPKRFSATVMLLRSLKQVFWKKSLFCFRYLHNNITMLVIPKVQDKAKLFQVSENKTQFLTPTIPTIMNKWYCKVYEDYIEFDKEQTENTKN